MTSVRRYLRELRESLSQLVADNLELMNVAMILRQAGWRGRAGGSISADVRLLVESWYDAERRAALLELALEDAS